MHRWRLLVSAAFALVITFTSCVQAQEAAQEGAPIVRVRGTLDAAALARLQRGLAYEGRPATPMKVSWQNETHLRFALKTPALGFIEYACDTAGLQLQALRRIRIGRLPLAGLAAGQWRYRLDYERF